MEYLWVGQYAQKQYYMIWGILAMYKNGYDGLAGDSNFTYVTFEGRSDKPIHIKSFQENERTVNELINRKQLKGYELISGGLFQEKYPQHAATVQQEVERLVRNKR